MADDTLSLEEANQIAPPAADLGTGIRLVGRIRRDAPAAPVARASAGTPTAETMTLDEASALPPPPPPPGLGEYIDNLVRQAANGATFGAMPYIAAAGNAGIGAIGDMFTSPTLSDLVTGQPRGFSARYDANLAQERQRDQQFEQQSPIAATTANIGGSVLGAMGAGRMLPSVFGISQAIPQGMRGTAQLARQSARVGGALGGISGALNTEGDIGDRAVGGVQGALLGATIGGVGAPVVRGATAIMAPVARAAGNAIGIGATAPGDILLRAFEADRIPITTAQARLSQWMAAGGRPETLVDLGGPNVRSLAQRLVNTPGASRAAGEAAVALRAEGQGARVARDVSGALGNSADFHPTAEALVAARSRAAQPHYTAAYAHEIPASQELLDVIRQIEAIAPGSVRGARQLALGEGQGGPQTSPNGVSTRWLDYLKRQLDDLIRADRNANHGQLSNRGRIINERRVDLLALMDEANPHYAAARAAFAGPSRLLDAMDQGLSIFRHDSEITARAIHAMSPSEREAFRLGVARAIQHKIESTTDGRNVVASFFRNPGMRNRIAAAFDSPAEFARFQEAVQREMAMAQNNQFMSPNAGSMTSRMLAEGADINTMIRLPPLSRMVLHPLASAQEVGSTMVDRAFGGRRSVSNALAPALFNTDPNANAAVLQMLRDREARAAAMRLGQQRAGVGLLGGGVSAGSPDAYGLLGRQ